MKDLGLLRRLLTAAHFSRYTVELARSLLSQVALVFVMPPIALLDHEPIVAVADPIVSSTSAIVASVHWYPDALVVNKVLTIQGSSLLLLK